MIKNILYCDRCGKETDTLSRVFTDRMATDAGSGRNTDLCAECSRKLDVFLDGGKLAKER